MVKETRVKKVPRVKRPSAPKKSQPVKKPSAPKKSQPVKRPSPVKKASVVKKKKASVAKKKPTVVKKKKEVPIGTKGKGLKNGFVKVPGGWSLDASSPLVLCRPGTEEMMKGIVWTF